MKIKENYQTYYITRGTSSIVFITQNVVHCAVNHCVRFDFIRQRNIFDGFLVFGHGVNQGKPMPGLRLMAFDLMDFRGVGDGFTKNIEASKDFIFYFFIFFIVLK